MTNKITKAIYCDTCVFISFLEATPGRIEIIDSLFDAIHLDDAEKLITSTYTITEAAFIEQERQQRVLAPNTLHDMDSLWTDTSLIQEIEYSDYIARLARGLIRDAMVRSASLKPGDAIHIATAQFAEQNGIDVVHFFTYDQALIKNSGVYNLHICEPFILQPRLPSGLNLASLSEGI